MLNVTMIGHALPENSQVLYTNNLSAWMLCLFTFLDQKWYSWMHYSNAVAV